MKTRILLVMVASSFLLGCCANKTRTHASISPFNLLFTDTELRSRTWTNASGDKLVCKGVISFKLKNQHDLVVAKYGTGQGTNLLCLDFYKKYEGLSGQEAPLFLLAHDSATSEIVAIDSSVDKNSLVITITRNTASKGSVQLTRDTYNYVYSRDGFVRGTSEFVDLPPPK